MEKSEIFTFKKVDRKASRERRHLRIYKRTSGTPERPRLLVYRGEKNIYTQIMDDANSTTLVSVSSSDKAFNAKVGGNKEAAKMVDELVAKKTLKKGASGIVFDRGGYVYHGRVQILVGATRETGLKF